MSLSSLPPLLLFPPSLSSLLPRLRAAGIFIYFASLYQRTMIFVDLTPVRADLADRDFLALCFEGFGPMPHGPLAL